MRCFCIILGLLVFFETKIFAQFETQHKHYLGYNVGAITGLGLSYRYQPNRLGIQSTAFFITNTRGHKYLNQALSLIYKLDQFEKSDLLLFAGYHSLISWIQRPSGNNVVDYEYKIFYDQAFGGGFGFSLFKEKPFNLNLLFGAVHINIDSQFRNNFWVVMPTAEIGVFYKL